MKMPTQVEVAVVGAGPTGLALGCVLRQAGVDALIVDKAPLGTNESRAAVLHARTLEVLEDLDLTPRLLAEGIVVPVFTLRSGRRRLVRLDFSGLPTAHPYTLMLPQSRTEELLTERLEELGGCTTRGFAVSALHTTSNGATLTLTGASGEEQTVQARYVVGADGMHSLVRESVGIGYAGAKYAQSFVLADVRMDWPVPAREVSLFFSAAGLVVVAPLPDGHHRVVATMDDAPENITTAHVQSLLDVRGPGAVQVHELSWASRFRVHHRLADTYRKGPVFLAGDAAHVHSPAGGQGMNTGIQDAVDLGHALADVLRNGAPDAGLDGYEARRRPVAAEVVKRTDRATRMATLSNPMARGSRNTALRLLGSLPPVRRRIAMQLAELSPAPSRRSVRESELV